MGLPLLTGIGTEQLWEEVKKKSRLKMKADMSQVLQAAKACHYAVPAMNYIDFASAKAYAKTSEKRKLPLILALPSRTASGYP